MKSGETILLLVKSDVDIELVESAHFFIKTFFKNDIVFNYPSDVKFADGIFTIPLDQDKTMLIGKDGVGGKFELEAQVNFKDGSIKKSKVMVGYMEKTLNNIMKSSKATQNNLTVMSMDLAAGVVVAKIEGLEVKPEDIEKAVSDYLSKNPVEAGITEEECNSLIEQYFSNNPIVTLTRSDVEEIVADYIGENPVAGSGGLSASINGTTLVLRQADDGNEVEY